MEVPIQRWPLPHSRAPTRPVQQRGKTSLSASESRHYVQELWQAEGRTSGALFAPGDVSDKLPLLLLGTAFCSRRWLKRTFRKKATQAQAEAVKERAAEVSGMLLEHQGACCQLVEWPLKKSALKVAEWLDGWRSGALNQDSELRFWSQRTVMAMQKRLEVILYGDDERSGRGTIGRPAPPDPRIWALHGAGGPESVPLAIAFTVERPFALAPLEAMHLENLVSQPGLSPEQRGVGAVLVQGLCRHAEEDGRVLTVDPQSAALETYFKKRGFVQAPALDLYTWYVPGEAQSEVEIRFGLATPKDYERLVGAFKRPPLWMALAEEVYICGREDTQSLDVLEIQVAREESAASRRKAMIRRLRRSHPGANYSVGPREEVDVNEAMRIMRQPELLEQVEWVSADGLGMNHGGRRTFVLIGRCSVIQKAFPLPGFGTDPKVGGKQLILEAIELPMQPEPIYSACCSCTLLTLQEDLEAVSKLLEGFHAKAALWRAPKTWNLELVKTEGLSAAALHQPPPGSGDVFADNENPDSD